MNSVPFPFNNTSWNNMRLGYQRLSILNSSDNSIVLSNFPLLANSINNVHSNSHFVHNVFVENFNVKITKGNVLNKTIAYQLLNFAEVPGCFNNLNNSKCELKSLKTRLYFHRAKTGVSC